MIEPTVTTNHLNALNAARGCTDGAEHRLRQVLDSISEGVILFDQDDRVVLFNEKYKELHPPIADLVEVGVTFEHILRQAALRGGIEVAADRIDGWVQQCVQQHLNPGAPFESKLRDGSWLRIAERRTEGGEILCVHTGITEVKRLQRDLELQSGLFRAVLDTIEHGMAVFDDELHLAACNSAFVRLLALPSDLATPGRSYLEILRFGADAGHYRSESANRHITSQLQMVADLSRAPKRLVKGTRTQITDTPFLPVYQAIPNGFVLTLVCDAERTAAEDQTGPMQGSQTSSAPASSDREPMHRQHRAA
ncbi:MAG TPA: PAS-domain containing protein [Microvirga sp.]|nr:PAS-domain containing protein [Microvirga sp.]